MLNCDIFEKHQILSISSNDTMDSILNQPIKYCGLDSNASVKWQKYFSELHLGLNYYTIRCLFSELIPTGTIILCNSYIIYHLIQIHHHLHQTCRYERRSNHSRTGSWMTVVLFFQSESLQNQENFSYYHFYLIYLDILVNRGIKIFGILMKHGGNFTLNIKIRENFFIKFLCLLFIWQSYFEAKSIDLCDGSKGEDGLNFNVVKIKENEDRLRLNSLYYEMDHFEAVFPINRTMIDHRTNRYS